MLSSYRHTHLSNAQRGINVVDLMMWLVIAALLLATAIQSIGYYQKAAILYQMTSDADGAGDMTMRSMTNTGVLNTETLEAGTSDAKWSKDVSYTIEQPTSITRKPYIRASHPSVNDKDVIYLFENCGDDYRIGTNVIPKNSTPVLEACGISSAGGSGSDTGSGGGTVVVPPPVSLTAWGWQGSGYLGNGSSFDTGLDPIDVTNTGALAGKNVAEVAASYNVACALAENKVYCWGMNVYADFRMLEKSTPTPALLPDQTAFTGKTLSHLTVGMGFGCVLADGKPYCWGKSPTPQISTSFSPVDSDPTGALAGKTITDMDAAQHRVCVVAAGDAYCWGGNNLGVPGVSATSIPSKADQSWEGFNNKVVTDVSLHDQFTCAIASGQAYCWGDNYYGILGRGFAGSEVQYRPQQVNADGILAGKTLKQVVTGYRHACALDTNGGIYCWGSRGFPEQLGNNSTTNNYYPVAVDLASLGGKKTTSLTAGYWSTCALAEGEGYCWGVNEHKTLADGTTANRSSPVPISSGIAVGRKLKSLVLSDGEYVGFGIFQD